MGLGQEEREVFRVRWGEVWARNTWEGEGSKYKVVGIISIYVSMSPDHWLII